MNTFIPRFESAWLAVALAVAFRGCEDDPMCSPSWSRDAGWPPTVIPCTTVPPVPEELFPSVEAVAVLVRDLILMAPPPMSMLSTTLLARALTGTTLRARSEEHTSELQSRPHLVCR